MPRACPCADSPSPPCLQRLGPLGIPVFGVCMGHQCIGQVFGGKVVRAPTGVMHGKTSPVFHTDDGLLKGERHGPADADGPGRGSENPHSCAQGWRTRSRPAATTAS